MTVRKPKIAVLGAGTVGAMTAAHWSRWPNEAEIEWVFSPNIAPVTVGEGTTVLVATALEKTLDFTYNDLADLGGTVKLGLWKEGWGDGHKFTPPFAAGSVGIHMTATKLHAMAQARLADRVRITERTVSGYADIDADFIADCSGTPLMDDTMVLSESVCVNAVHVVQCPWEYPRFNMSLTIARPFGWVFGIPLQNRCAIGYLYNEDINTLEEVQQDLQQVFDKFALTPSNTTLTRSFKSYRRKENFHKRGYYNGNASFFLEPLEATSLGCSVQVNQHAWSAVFEQLPLSTANRWYADKLSSVEDLLAVHYLAKSVYKTPFWEYAHARATTKIDKSIATSAAFRNTLKAARDFRHGEAIDIEYGTWGPWMWNENLTQLGVMDTLLAKLNKFEPEENV